MEIFTLFFVDNITPPITESLVFKDGGDIFCGTITQS